MLFRKPTYRRGLSIESNNTRVDTIFENESFTVLGSTGDMTFRKSNYNNKSLSDLIETSKKYIELKELNNIEQLSQVDTAACLNKMRTTAEKLSIFILNHLKINNYKLTFNDRISLIQKSQVLSSRTIGYFHTVRVIGNLASHPNDFEMSEKDVKIMSYALSSIIDELISKNILKK